MKEKKLIGKKMLMLGTSVASVSMVEYARSEGAYVIVTDNLSPEQSKAKLIADEIANVSTRDIDALCNLVREKQIDGVISGVSEGNLIAAQKVCKKMNLPCYFTEKQWELCENKREFKKLCESYGVPVPRTYKTEKGILLDDISTIEFPVIVKPVDGSAAQGITICHNEQELINACKVALNCSESKEITVEDYLIGTEITTVYTFCNGKISLSLMRDRYPSKDHEGVTAQFDASIGPSEYYKRYIKTVDSNVKAMLSGIGATYGTVFFQGIATEERICIFECGYRMNALCDYYNLEAANGINYMKMLVDYSLTGTCNESELSKDNPDPNEFCCVFNMTAHGGIVGSLQGEEEAKKVSNVLYAEFLVNEGKEIIENNSMAQSVFRCYINAKNRKELQNTILRLQKIICVQDTEGKDMLFRDFDVERIVDTLSMK